MSQKIYFNPITNLIKNSLDNSENEIIIAVPFITSFAKSILTEERLSRFKTKRILTRFDESNLNTFDLDTFKYLLDNNVEIRFNNDIHLKLYLFDNQGFISSSNLTKSGFESSIEITNSIENKAIKKCKDFFEKLWNESSGRIITQQLIEENYQKYLLLKRKSNSKKRKSSIQYNESETPDFNQKLIDYLLNNYFENIHKRKKILEANKVRENFKKKLREGFNIDDFCRKEKNDNTALSHILIYGEKPLAAAGLYVQDVEEAFRNKKFAEAIAYIYPPIIGKPDWDLRNTKQFEEYCNGIFEFDIKYYKEGLPIRLASYFYPDDFLPIFKLEHLNNFCRCFGVDFAATSYGDKLFACNNFLIDKIKHVPYDNYYKAKVLYLLQRTISLSDKLKNGETYQIILEKTKKSWDRIYTEQAKEVLDKLGE